MSNDAIERLIAFLATDPEGGGAELAIDDTSRGDERSARVRLAGREELPLVLVPSETEVRVMLPLLRAADIEPDKREEACRVMLELNTLLPLSFVAAYREHYWLMGAVRPDADPEELIHEIEVLAANADDAVLRLADFTAH